MVEGPATILLVDDDESLRRLARYILSDHGYHVIEASDSAEALKIASAHSGSIDLLLTDVIMPKLDGIVLADRILQHRPGMAVLFTSENDESALLSAGHPHVNLLPKPFRADQLVYAVRGALVRWAVLRARAD
jgi:DNA-binding NtrC family response regulator